MEDKAPLFWSTGNRNDPFWFEVTSTQQLKTNLKEIKMEMSWGFYLNQDAS